MYIIIDWQNEEDIIVVKRGNETLRVERIEDATLELVNEWNNTGNIYLRIVEV